MQQQIEDGQQFEDGQVQQRRGRIMAYVLCPHTLLPYVLCPHMFVYAVYYGCTPHAPIRLRLTPVYACILYDHLILYTCISHVIRTLHVFILHPFVYLYFMCSSLITCPFIRTLRSQVSLVITGTCQYSVLLRHVLTCISTERQILYRYLT